MENSYLEEIFTKLENATTTISEEAKKLNIDRKTLRERLKKQNESRYKKIEENRNIKKQSKSSERIRGKKLEEEKNHIYQKNIRLLDEIGIDENLRQQLYSLLSRNKHTKMTKGTFVDKLLQMFLLFILERNKGLEEKDMGYITKKDVIDMILLEPKVMTNDVKRKMRARFEYIDRLPWATREKTNQIIIQAPGIFDSSHERFGKQMIILSNFWILQKGAYVQEASQYVLENKANQQLKTSPEKMYQRLRNLKDKKKSNIFTIEEYEKAIRDKSMDNENEEQYILPNYNEKNVEKFKKEIKEQINNSKNIEKGEK